MKKFLLSLFFLFSSTAFSQTWEELNYQVHELINKGEYEKAIPIAEQAMAITKKTVGNNHPDYATSLNNLAFLYESKGQFEKAEILFLEAINIYKKALGETHPDYATSINNLSYLYERIGQYKKAEPLYLESIEIQKKTLGESHPDYTASLNLLANLYLNMGQYEKAEPLYLGAKKIYKRVLGETHPSYATSINNLAFLYEKMAQYEKAETLYLKSIDIDKKTIGVNHPDYVTSLHRLAVLYMSIGQYEKSEPLFLEANEINKKTIGENHLENVGIFIDLANLYFLKGQYEKVESLYARAKEIRKKELGEIHPDYAITQNNLAELYRSLGQYEKSELLNLNSLDLLKKADRESHPDYATCLSNLALIYSDMGKYEKAEQLYLESKEITKKALGESHPEYAASLNNLGFLYTNMGQYEKAETVYLESKEIREKTLGESHPEYARSLNNLALLYASLGQYEKSEPLYLKAVEIRKTALGESHLDYAASLNNSALSYQMMRQFDKAENYFIKSNKIVIDNLKKIFTGLSEEEKGNYLSNNINLNNTNNSFLFQYPRATPTFYKECYDLQLLLKSLSLTDTKAGIGAIRKSTNEIVIKLYEKWQTNKNILAKQYAVAVANQRKDLKEFEDKTEELEKELNRKSATFKKNQESFTITAQKVWNKLQDKEVAIEFVKFRIYRKGWTDSVMYAAYILKKKDSIPLFIPLCEEKQIQQLFNSAGTTATTMVNNFYRGVDLGNTNSVQFLGTALYKLIWEPLEPYLKEIKKVSYSPAGKLFSVAFQALPVDSNTVLMDKYELQQYTSTRQIALRTEEKQNIKPTNITLFGNASFTMDSLQLVKQKTVIASTNATSIYTPKNRNSEIGVWNDLPGTAKEVKKIKQLFDENKISTKTFVQTVASEENLKALSGNSPQILHIATHGFFLPEADKKRKENSFNNENSYTLAEDPLLRSGLILSGGNYAWSGKTPIAGVEDGIATAYEISQLNLSNTELVVLSACETALGDVKGSEGVFGLQRAFKMAGVKKMIVSLWQVPDKETAELMTVFYTNWMKGKTIEESFTQAQAEMRKKYSPFYWAAFVLVE